MCAKNQMTTTSDESRFLPLVKSIVSQTQRELVSNLTVEQLMPHGMSGLSEGLVQYRSRQGLTQRAYLSYRIRARIYSELSKYEWPSEEARAHYLFLKKTNELLLNFHLSAEGATKRSIQAEETEVLDLLRLMTIVALLSGNQLCPIELEDSIQKLESTERDFIELYYGQDLDLIQVSERLKVSLSAAFRSHWRTLDKLAILLPSKFAEQ